MQVKEIIKYLDTRNGISINNSVHFRTAEELEFSLFCYDEVDKVSIGRNGSLVIFTKFNKDKKIRYKIDGVIMRDKVENTFSICTPLVSNIEEGVAYIHDCISKMNMGDKKVIIERVEECGSVVK